MARAITSRFLALASGDGYRELGLSALTSRSELDKSTGTGSDVVAKELVTLQDGVYAPEGTPQVLSYAFDRPGRYSYVQSMMRGERLQRGRLREFTQLGVEDLALRPLSPLQALPSLELLWEVLAGYDTSTRLGYLGCSACQDALRDALLGVTPSCPDCVRRQGTNPVRMLDCKVCDRSSWPTFDRVGCAPCTSARDALLSLLGDRVTYDPFVVRGLDYYQGPVWEVECDDLIVGGGGMYAAEVSRGGSSRTLCGVGWAVGLERLLLATPPPPPVLGPPAAALLSLDPASLLLARQVAAREGRVALYGTLRDVLRRADQLSCPDVLVLGDRELASGRAFVKDLATGQQRPFDL